MIRGPRSLRGRILLLGVVFEGGLRLLAMLLGWLFDLPLWSLMSLDLVGSAQGLAAVLPMLAMLLATAHSRLAPLRQIRQILDDSFLPLFRDSRFVDLALIALLAGLGEEFVFRGVLQVGLEKVMPLWGAIALASLLFGLAHAITPAYAVLAGLVSVYFGVLFAWTGSLYVVALAHAAYDLIALVYLLGIARRRSE